MRPEKSLAQIVLSVKIKVLVLPQAPLGLDAHHAKLVPLFLTLLPHPPATLLRLTFSFGTGLLHVLFLLPETLFPASFVYLNLLVLQVGSNFSSLGKPSWARLYHMLSWVPHFSMVAFIIFPCACGGVSKACPTPLEHGSASAGTRSRSPLISKVLMNVWQLAMAGAELLIYSIGCFCDVAIQPWLISSY